MLLVFTVAGLSGRYKIPFKGTLSPQEKKKLRLQIAGRLPHGFIPLHAALISKNDEAILISGPADSGKSSLAEHFSKQGYQVMANDFSVVWEKEGKLMAGDLNFIDVNRSKSSKIVKKIIFLSPDDPRDCFCFSRQELAKFYCQTFTPMAESRFKRFYTQPLFEKIFNSHFVIGNRQSVKRWVKIISFHLLDQSKNRVGIIGLGTIGQSIANLLLTLRQLGTLGLFTPNQQKLKGITLDLRSARPDLRIAPFSSSLGVIKNSDILILCFRVKTDKPIVGVGERMQKFAAHAEVIWQLSRLVRKAKYKGKILVVTNPIDALSWATYFYSNLNDRYQLDWQGLSSDQVMGVGLGLDFARLQTIMSGDSEVLGEHGENFILCQPENRFLTKKELPRVKNLVKTYSERIRKYTERTVYGPSHEILHLVECLMNKQEISTIRISALDKRGLFLGNIFDVQETVFSPRYDFADSLKTEIDRISEKMKPFQTQEKFKNKVN